MMQGKTKILVLMASARGYPDARINAEARTIKNIIEAPGNRDRFSIDLRPAARPADLLGALRDHGPDIVHFCGHGEHGRMFLHDHEDDAQPVSPDDLAEIFRASGHRARLALFNVCHSLGHAEAVVDHVDCAIAVNTTISDRAAVEFAASFYRTLSAGKPMASAYDEALALLRAAGLAVPGAPDMRCLRAPASTSRRVATRIRRRWLAVLAAMIGVVVVLVIGMLMVKPTTSIPRFADGAGIVVVGPGSSDGEQERAAFAHLTSELRSLGAQHVHTVERSFFTDAGDDDLVRIARNAGASLLIAIDSGPTVRMVPIPGTRGSAFIEQIPPLHVATEDTRKTLAPILFALAWSAVKDPTAPYAKLDVPISSTAQVTDDVAILAIYLRHLKDPRDESWYTQAEGVLAAVVQTCRDPLNGWTCAMAHYLRYGLMYPRHPDAAKWFQEVSERGSGPIGDAALVELMEQRCVGDSEWVTSALQTMNGQWDMRDCGRLALAVPANCLIIQHDRREAWLGALASPEYDDFKDRCGDMPARTLARIAALHGDQGDWHAAETFHARAMAMSPANKTYALDWIAALLQMEPRPDDLVERVTAQVNIDSIEGRWRIHAEFLWWLLTDDHRRAGARICGAYRTTVSSDRRAIPPLTHLGRRLCATSHPPDNNDVRCRVYEILSAGKTESSASELCRLLRAAAGG